MPKVSASLADVSTKFELVDPGEYDLKIIKVDDKSADGREAYLIVTEVDEPGTDMHGRKIFHNISMTTKKKEPNTAGMAELKRYFEAVFGEETVATFTPDDYDTDELVNQRFHAAVIIDSWETGVRDEPGFKEGKNNKIKQYIYIG